MTDRPQPPTPDGTTVPPASDGAAAPPASDGATPRADTRSSWSRLARMGRPRLTRANLLVTALAVLLGIAIAAQVQITRDRGLAELSQTDLIRVLDDVTGRSDRLDAQLRELEATRDRLQSGTGSQAEALEQAQKRLTTLGILSGTVGVRGPGITFTITDPGSTVTAPVILDLIMELRDAGAEAIDVGGVRVVAQSYVGTENGSVTVDGVPLTSPIVVKAIGDKATLASALKIPGGIIDTVRQKGATGEVEEADGIEITSLHAVTTFNNARPVS